MAATRGIEGGTHTALDRSDPVFTWDYQPDRTALAEQLVGATGNQWSFDDLPWATEVDPTAMAVPLANLARQLGPSFGVDADRVAHWGDAEWLDLGIELQQRTLSGFLHGEQGALLCCGKLIEAAPWVEVKQFASIQAVDEARHMAVLAAYLDDKLAMRHPIGEGLRNLLDDVLADGRWDMTYLGMQLVSEGYATAGFGLLRQMAVACGEPLLAEILRRILADEARHMAFCVATLREVYAGLRPPELRERQEATLDVVLRVRDQLLAPEMWSDLGVPTVDDPGGARSPAQQVLDRLLFSKVVTACDAVGLLDAGARAGAGGWLRQQLEAIGILTSDEPLRAVV